MQISVLDAMIYKRQERFMEELLECVQKKRFSRPTLNYNNIYANWTEYVTFIKNIARSFQIYRTPGLSMLHLNIICKKLIDANKFYQLHNK